MARVGARARQLNRCAAYYVLPLSITSAFLLLVAAGIVVARKYDPVTAYVGFVWVIPVASVVWLKWGENKLGFGESFFNIVFVLGVIIVGFVVGVLCLPIILYLNWQRLSGVKIGGLILCGMLHALPFLLYVSIWVFVLIWGK